MPKPFLHAMALALLATSATAAEKPYRVSLVGDGFDGKAWHNLTTTDGLAGNIVYAIARGADGVYWFGTDKGVSRYDGKAWRNFGRNEGLLDNHVYALALGPKGDVWAGTRRGVVRIGRP